MRITAKAELIVDDISATTNDIELDISEFELGEIELDKRVVVNIREKAGMLMKLVDHSSEIIYGYPPRTKHEINGGYKIAKRKGARLEEVKVYNLFFRFKSWLDGTGLALMCRPPGSNEEWIILLPDDTMRTIEKERRYYLDIARQYALVEQIMEPNEQDRLLHNLNRLNIHERCAQSLMHEFGHVLHWRVFDDLGLYDTADIYQWFYETGYLKNVDKRFPNLGNWPPSDQVYILKESLVEDYRISLNLKAENGIFILPNKFCYSGDFQIPELMLEGVEIMSKMLRSRELHGNRPTIHHTELDAIEVGRYIENTRQRTRWTPGTPSLSDEDIFKNINKLRMNDTKLQVAVALS
jgi:hypothetical protein